MPKPETNPDSTTVCLRPEEFYALTPEQRDQYLNGFPIDFITGDAADRLCRSLLEDRRQKKLRQLEELGALFGHN